MNAIEVTQLASDPRSDFVFEVELAGGYKYTVWFTQAYNKKLTSGKVDGTELVQKSFEFLLEREGPESILPEFDLKLISHYFPEYEDKIRQALTPSK